MERKIFGTLTKTLIVGVGGRGLNALQRLSATQLVTEMHIGISHEQKPLEIVKCKIKYKVELDEKDRFLSFEKMIEQNSLLNNRVIIVINGLGGESEIYVPELLEKIKRDNNLIFSIVSLPFSFEAKERHEKAKAYLKLIDKKSDIMVVLPNDSILRIADKNTTLSEALEMQDEVVMNLIDTINAIDEKMFATGISKYEDYIGRIIADRVPEQVGYVNKNITIT